MEYKVSPIGTRLVPVKYKNEAVEKKYSTGMTWVEIANWFNKKYNTELESGTFCSWGGEHRRKQQGIVGERSKQAGGARAWTQAEVNFLTEAWEIGLKRDEIAILMNETPEFEGLRQYTTRSVINKLCSLGLKATAHTPDPKHEERMKQRIEERGYKMVKFLNSHHIVIECNDCGLVSRKTSDSIFKTNCAGCVESPSSYQEVYLIEFAGFDYPSVKVGISHNFHDKSKSYNRSKFFPDYKLIALYETNYTTAREIEMLIRKEYGIYKTDPHELHFSSTAYSGSTECYDISQAEAIKKTIEERLNG